MISPRSLYSSPPDPPLIHHRARLFAALVAQDVIPLPEALDALLQFAADHGYSGCLPGLRSRLLHELTDHATAWRNRWETATDAVANAVRPLIQSGAYSPAIILAAAHRAANRIMANTIPDEWLTEYLRRIWDYEHRPRRYRRGR